MTRWVCRVAVWLVLAAPTIPTASGQTFPSPDYFRLVFQRPGPAVQVPGPEGLEDLVVSGRLRLQVDDVVRLVLRNNTEVRISQLNVQQTTFGVGRAYQPFDPALTSGFNATRATQPTISQLEGAQTLSDLSQQTRVGYSQLLQTGTRFDTSLGVNRSSTNSVFALFNPSYFSNLTFSVTQPLLRNRGLFPNRAPIVIARRSVARSRATFEAEINEAIARAVNQYWSVVEARENLAVLRRSLDLADATYEQNKRALELGALPPLDIYRSESQVAQRRVAVIQAEYQLKQLEDDLRRTIGADLDDYIRALDIDLVDRPSDAGDPGPVDAESAYQLAVARRPELEALRQQLANDDDSVRLAFNGAQPDLSLTAFYTSSGRGGNRLDTSVTPPAIVAPGGLGDSFSQLGTFNFPTYGVNLQFRLPLRNRSAEADLGSALVSKRQSLYQLRQRQQSLWQEVRNAVHQLEQARLSIAAARLARDLSQKNLEAEERKYELGVQTIFFVLEAQTQLAQAEQALLRAEIDYQRARIAYDRSTGAQLDRYRVIVADATP